MSFGAGTRAGIILSAEDQTSGAFASVKRNMAGLQQQASGLTDGLGATAARLGTVGAALTAAFAGASLKGAIDMGDKLDDLSEKTGIAVRELSALRYAGEVTGTPLDALATGIRKLSVNMAEAAGGAKEQAALFKTLGINVKELDGSLKGSDKVLGELADKFSNFKDGPEKAALAIQVFGKAGADMIPLLNQGSRGIEDLRDEATKLGAVIGEDFARQSAAFNDNLKRIELSSESFKSTIASELLPTLNTLAEVFIDGRDGVNTFAQAFGGTLRNALQASTVLFANVAFVLNGVGREIGAIAAQTVALATLDIKGFTAISDAVREDAARARKELDALESRILGTNLSLAGAGRGTEADPRSLGSVPSIRVQIQGLKTNAPIVGGKSGAAGDKSSPYDAINKAIQERLALADQELTVGRALTEQEKFEVKQLEALRLAKDKITAAQEDNIRLTLEESRVKDLALQVERATIASAKELSAERQRLRNADNQSVSSFLQEQEAIAQRTLASLRERSAAIRDNIEATQLAEQANAAEANETIRSAAANSNLAIAVEKVAIARAREKLERLNPDGDEAERIRQEIAERERLIEVLGEQRTAEIGVAQAREAQTEWRKLSDSIQQGLTDSLFRAFESGKGFFKTFWDGIKNTFKTTILKVAIQGVSNSIGGFFGLPSSGGLTLDSLLGMTGSGNSGGGLGSIGSLFSNGSSANSLANVFNNGLSSFTAPGSTYYNIATSGVGQSLGLSNSAAIAGNNISAYAPAGTQLTGAGAGSGTAGGLGTAAAGAAAIAVIAYAFYQMYENTKGEKRDGGGYRYDASTGKISDLPGPSGGDAAADANRKMVESSVLGINAALKAVGSTATVIDYQAMYESSINGRGGVFSGLTLSDGRKLGEDGSGTNYEWDLGPGNSKYETWGGIMGSMELAGGGRYNGIYGMEAGSMNGTPEKLATDQQQLFLQAVQAGVGLVPEIVRREFDIAGYTIDGETQTNVDASKGYTYDRIYDQAIRDALKGTSRKLAETGLFDIDPELLSKEDTEALTAKVGALINNVNGFRTIVEALPVESLKSATFDIAATLVELSGGIEQFATNIGAYVQNFYTAEEQRRVAAGNIAKVLQGAGSNVTIDDVLGASNRTDGRALFRSLVEQSEKDTSDAGLKITAALYSVAGSFAAITPVAQEAAESVSEVMDALAEAQAFTDSAFSSLESAIAAQRTLADLERDLAQERVDNLRELQDLLKSNIRDLFGEVDSTRMQAADQARQFIGQALATARTTGYLPDAGELSDAIGSARQGLDKRYASRADRDYDRLVLANQLKDLSEIAGPQLTVAEQTLKAALDQLAQLDTTLEYWRTQIDISRSGVKATLSIGEAITQLTAALRLESGGKAPAAGTLGSVPSGASGPFVTGAAVGTSQSQNALSQAIQTTLRALDWGNYESAFRTAYAIAKEKGWSSGDIGAALGINAWDIRADTERFGLPAFARGGSHAGGWAMVGERGPEVAWMPPARIYSADQSRDMMDSGPIVAKLEAIEQRLLMIESYTSSTAGNTSLAVNRPNRVKVVS